MSWRGNVLIDGPKRWFANPMVNLPLLIECLRHQTAVWAGWLEKQDLRNLGALDLRTYNACKRKCSLKKANILFYFSSKFKFVPEFQDFFYLNHSFLACKAWFWKIDFGSNHHFPPSYHFVLNTKHFTFSFLLLPNIATSSAFRINLLHLARARAMKIAHFRL